MVRCSAIVLAACLLLAAPAAGDNGGKLGQLQSRISAAHAKEARLTQQISGLTVDIRRLEARVGDVSQKLSVLERDLELHQRRLDKLNALYAFQTERLTFLRRAYAKAVHELNLRMVDLYTTPDPTLVEVIIESDSFQDALEQIHYLGAIAQQDKPSPRACALRADQVHVPVNGRRRYARACMPRRRLSQCGRNSSATRRTSYSRARARLSRQAQPSGDGARS